MDSFLKLNHFFKALSFSVAIFMFQPCVNAWTIQALNPSVNPLADYILPGGQNSSIFQKYITDTGSTLTSGTLQNYNLGDADAVIVNLFPYGNSFTTAEINVLKNILNSNTRILVFAENENWAKSNGQLATLLGGSYTGQGQDYQGSTEILSLLTEGVSNVYFGTPGKISPKDNNGISLTDGDGMTLWGENNNFLLFMDINALANNNIMTLDNNQLALNVASWLAGGDIVIPEPSTYSLIAGFALLGGSIIRRRR